MSKRDPLAVLRFELDTIDDQIVALLKRRFRLVELVAVIKASHTLPAHDRGRELAIKARLEQRLGDVDADTRGQVLEVMGDVVRRGRERVQAFVEALRRHDRSDAEAPSAVDT